MPRDVPTYALLVRRLLRLIARVVREAVHEGVREAVREAVRAELDAAADGRGSGPAPLLTLAETAGVLGVSKRTVERIVRRGDLGTVRAEGSRRIHPATLDAYVRSRAR